MCIKKVIRKTIDLTADIPVLGMLLKPKPKVAVLRLSGVISAGSKRQAISHERYGKLIENAFDVINLKALALIINSPGGSPAQSALIANDILRLSEEKNVPVYAFVEDVAASGGYWLACAASKIYAQDVSIVGSIGVISASFGFEELIERHGVKRRVHTSGTNKSFLDPFTEESPKDVKRLLAIQKELHQSFITWVKEQRGDILKGADKSLFEGQFWTGTEAVENGIIDGLGDMRSICKDELGQDIKFVEIIPEKRWLPEILSAKAPSIAQDTIDTVETRGAWARYGL